MATFVFYDEFKLNVTNANINLSTDTFKIALSNTVPQVTNHSQFIDVSEISAGNGYTAGGQALDSVTWDETGAGTGIWQFTSADEVFTASGGSIGPFRYIALYSDTSTNDKLVGYLDYGSSISITDGNTFTVDVGAGGWFTLDG